MSKKKTRSEMCRLFLKICPRVEQALYRYFLNISGLYGCF